MLSWFFKKRASVPAKPLPEAGKRTVQGPVPGGPAATASPKSRQDGDGIDWPARLREAQGDDAALLRIAQAQSPPAIHIAAIEALTDEASLRQAERHFRKRDRKTHRLAKQRLAAAVARRESRAAADGLLQRTDDLLAGMQVPLNHVAAIDREWAQLSAPLLQSGQIDRFTERREQLDRKIREQGDAEQRERAWLVEAMQTLAGWPAGVAAVAAHGTEADMVALSTTLSRLLQSRPDAASTVEAERALQKALQFGQAVHTRLAGWEHQAADAPASLSSSALPALDDDAIQRLLSARHDAWMRAQRTSPADAGTPAQQPVRAERPPPPAPLAAAQREAIEAQVLQAEAALEDGRTGEMQQQIQALESAIDALGPVRLPTDLRSRHLALRTEAARLRGWQTWSGGRAREDLTEEAEELARQTVAAAPVAPATEVTEVAAGKGSAETQVPVPVPTALAKLNLRAHAQQIQGLRLHWKELDRVGAPMSQPLWERFDAALKTAFGPVAAQRAAIDDNRRRNLETRQALLDALDAAPGPDPSGDLVEGGPTWKDVLQHLNAFQLEWRKLGPPEHTVPVDARQNLQQRLRSSLDRLELPLHQARRVAVDRRELLITQAAALKTGSGSRLGMADAMRQLRDLQAEWQQQAREVPLARAVENELWERFKAATDAFFARRDAEWAAREAEFAAALAAHEGLLVRLDAIQEDSAESRRTLEEIDRAWREGPELPRAEADRVGRQYQESRRAAAERLSVDARRRWQAQCATLASALALQEEAESGTADAAQLEQRRLALDPLPAGWERAIELRRSQAASSDPLQPGEVDEWLLHLESALDLPATPEWLEQRRALKLRALKQTMEGRETRRRHGAEPAERLSTLLQQTGLSDAQRLRLKALIAALGQAEPGTWLPTAARRQSGARAA